MPVLTPAPTTRGDCPKYVLLTSTKAAVNEGTPLHIATAETSRASIPRVGSMLDVMSPYSSAVRPRSVLMRHDAAGIYGSPPASSANTPILILVLPMSSARSIGPYVRRHLCRYSSALVRHPRESRAAKLRNVIPSGEGPRCSDSAHYDFLPFPAVSACGELIISSHKAARDL